MAYQLRTADPGTDKGLVTLLDEVFQRTSSESRLLGTLAASMPSFDPGLSLVATRDGKDVAFALFLPRRFRFRGCEVPLVISSPFGTLPSERGKGAGRFLLEAGLAALADRGIRGAIVLGGSSFFARHGYEGAFNLYTIDASAKLAGDGPSTASWSGLSAEDLPHLMHLYTSNYSSVAGSEVRSSAPIDWESSGRDAYTVVTRRDKVAVAYVRFRVREKLAVMECGALDADAVRDVRAFIGRLAAEHHRSGVEVHLPPPHPVFRALFRAGCMAEGNSFHDEARLRITDWKGFFEDTASSFVSAMALSGVKSLSLGLDTHAGQADWKLTRRGDADLTVQPGRAKLHLQLPTGWAEPLMTGRLDWRDIDFAAESKTGLERELLHHLFPTGTPMWTY